MIFFRAIAALSSARNYSRHLQTTRARSRGAGSDTFVVGSAWGVALTTDRTLF
ncbi:hypothetical protein F7734_03055 [Scytonema sp. UIC 10036]|uniref:hypothetical protein n=1 Tax=Scytonema sp. UIC 10036 TaxID=2304196 RepID=UPI0012DA272D|nr:hypothetical protein [Scytonema sp. UIC 10036]MUG91519.1 hypothetical protein [Scytonema sp. UIC 10036]